uniref:MADF domain-containing protein n=1 Tax=Heliothis virescens TaxID=7102 RepID=A0A2A4JYX0_HELVI
MATALTDEWTEDKCIQLIREFRTRPVLWDQKDPLFFKKTVKPKAWQEIGHILNISPDKCKHKMIILMSSFRREKAKIMNSIKETGDPSQAYKSTWFAFKDMAFLLDKENERKRQLINSTDDDVDDEDDDTIFHNNLIRNLETPVPMKRCRLSLSVRKELGQKLADLERTRSIPILQSAPGPSQTPEERDEEIKSFTTFIGNKMKKYSDITKNAVQQAICDVIFKADQNYYEPHCFEKFTIIDDETDPLNRAIYDLQTDTEIKVQHDSDNSD